MICQRSGLCCTTMAVAIRIGNEWKWKPDGVMCPHLTFQEGTTIASCAVHDEPWYKDTPCFVYGNPDLDPDYSSRRGKPCRVGEMAQRNGGLLQIRPNARKATVEELEHIAAVEE